MCHDRSFRLQRNPQRWPLGLCLWGIVCVCAGVSFQAWATGTQGLSQGLRVRPGKARRVVPALSKAETLFDERRVKQGLAQGFPLTPFWRRLPVLSSTQQASLFLVLRRGKYRKADRLVRAWWRKYKGTKRDRLMLAWAHQLMSIADAPRAIALYQMLRKSRTRFVAISSQVMLARYYAGRWQETKLLDALSNLPESPKVFGNPATNIWARKLRRYWCAGTLILAESTSRTQKNNESHQAWRRLAKFCPLLADTAASARIKLWMREKKYKTAGLAAIAFKSKYPKSRYVLRTQLWRASALERRKKWSAMRRLYRRLRRQVSRSRRKRVDLSIARSLQMQGKNKAAQAIYLRLLRRSPGSNIAARALRGLRSSPALKAPQTRLSLGIHRYRQARYKAAIQILMPLTKIKTSKRKKLREVRRRRAAKAACTVGRAWFRLKKNTKAKAALKLCLRHLRSPAMKSRMKLLWIRANYREQKSLAAVKAYETFWNKRKASKRRLVRRSLWWAAQLYSEHKKTKKSIQLFLRYAKRYPRSRRRWEAVLKVGLVYYQKGRYAQCIRALRRLAKMPTQMGAQAQFWTAKAWLKRKKRKRAMAVIVKMKRYRDPYYWARAQTLRSGRPLLAKTPISLYKLILTQPEEMALRVRLARWYRRTKKAQLGALVQSWRRERRWQRAWFFAMAGSFASARAEMRVMERKIKAPIFLMLQAQAWARFGVPHRTLSTMMRFLRRMPAKRRRGMPGTMITRLRFPIAYPHLYMKYGARYKVRPLMMHALTRQESLFNPRIRSGAGALGIAQIMPKDGRMIAKRWGLRGYRRSWLLRPSLNLRMGFSHFRDYLDRYNNHIELTMVAYNAGPSPLARWKKEHPGLAKHDLEAFLAYGIGYRETRGYVPHCFRWYTTYRYLPRS